MCEERAFSMSKAGNIVKITFKSLMLGISLFIYAFFIFRLCTMDDPKEMTKIIWNDVSRAAYAADPAGFEALDQEPNTYINNEGTFWISNVVYLPSADQLQLTIKYNDSTLKYLKQALGDETLVLPDEPFSYSLLDEDGNRYTAYSSVSHHKQNYNYRRLVFEGIDMTDITDLYVDIYYVGNINYGETPYGSLKAWDADLATTPHDVEKDLPDDLK